MSSSLDADAAAGGVTLAIHPAARDEVLAALAHYAEIDGQGGTELFDDLRDRIEAAFLRINDAPRSFPSHSFGTRRCLLRRFPYAIIFDVEPSPLVVAFAHVKRRPGYWKRRAEPAA